MLPKVLLMLMFMLVTFMLMLDLGHALPPAAKEHSQFLRKVGAALGDLAAVVLEMNDPYVLERLSSKDQAHQFLVNFLKADTEAPRRGELYLDADSPHRRWSYMSLRNLGGGDEEEEGEGDDSRSLLGESSEEAAAAAPTATGPSGATATGSGGYRVVEDAGEEEEALVAAPAYLPSGRSSSSSSSEEEREEERGSQSDEPLGQEPETYEMRSLEEQSPELDSSWSEESPESRLYVQPPWTARKHQHVAQSAEVPCSGDDDDEELEDDDEELEDEELDDEELEADDMILEVDPPQGGRREQDVGSLTQVVKSHLWNLVTEATGKLKFQVPRKLLQSVEIHAKQILADLLQAVGGQQQQQPPQSTPLLV